VRNCIVGFVHTQLAGFGARRPATSSTAGSSALEEVFQVLGSTPEAATADGELEVGALAEGAAEGAEPAAGALAPGAAGTIGAGGFGAGASEHDAAHARVIEASRTFTQARGIFMGP